MVVVFTKDVLFLHVPKTGGASVAQYLLRVLPRPVHYIHTAALQNFAEPGIEYIRGRTHSNIEDAAAILGRHAIDMQRMPLILAVLRNPYDLAVSYYAWFGRPGDVTHERHPLRQLAVHGTFREFVIAAARQPANLLGRARAFFYLRGTVPPNLRIVCFDHLESDVTSALSDIGVHHDAEFPHSNRSTHEAFPTYYDALSEEIVFAKNRWAFERGYFDRLRID